MSRDARDTRPTKWWQFATRWSGLKTAWQDLQVRFAIFFVLVYLTIQVPVTKAWLANVGVDNDWLNVGIILPIILTLVLWQTVEITHRLEEIESTSSLLPRDRDVLTAVFNSMENVKNPKQRTLDVIGLSLSVTWPRLKSQIDNGSFDEWTIQLSAFVGGSGAGHAPVNWARDGRRALNEISAYGRRPRIRDRKIKVSSFAYEHTPAVHGFRVGNGDIYLATLAWTRDGNKLVSYPANYEFVPRADKSAYAKAKRDLFRSWSAASTRVPHPPTNQSTNSGAQGETC